MQYIIDLGGRTDAFAQAIPQLPKMWVYDNSTMTAT
jgi:hypothetical protein